MEGLNLKITFDENKLEASKASPKRKSNKVQANKSSGVQVSLVLLRLVLGLFWLRGWVGLNLCKLAQDVRHKNLCFQCNILHIWKTQCTVFRQLWLVLGAKLLNWWKLTATCFPGTWKIWWWENHLLCKIVVNLRVYLIPSQEVICAGGRQSHKGQMRKGKAIYIYNIYILSIWKRYLNITVPSLKQT